MRTKAEILQRNRLDVNSFFFSKTLKANYISGSNKKNLGRAFFRDGQKPEAQDSFFGLSSTTAEKSTR